jgi:DNA-directed RNA polymerase subunit RPC12/RpoP
MPGREYVCGDCGHYFGDPEGEAVSARTLMCPGCGSIDLTIVRVDRAPRIVMRATEPPTAGAAWRRPDNGSS